MEKRTIPRRLQVAHAHKEEGGWVAAVLPIHYPRALLRAFGILPIEVWGPPQVDASYGAAHLQPYVCSIVRNALSFIQTEGLDVADFIVVPHACDSLQGLGSILLDFVRPRQPVIPLYLPRGQRESDLHFLADELRALYRRLAELTHHSPSDGELMQHIQREEEADRLLADLHHRRQELPFTQFELYRLIRSREYLPAETFFELARATLLPVRSNDFSHSRMTTEVVTTNSKQKGIPIILSGIVPEPMSLFSALAEMGGTIVADDLACCGRRLYPPGTNTDPFLRMAESILAAPPDAMRGSPIQDRLAYLLRLAETSGARGIVFYDVKFCEPELFDLPILRKRLHEAGIPSVALEVDLNDPLSHQVLTRLEAFLEMIA